MKSKDAKAESDKLVFKVYEKAGSTGVGKYAILEDGIVLIFKDRPDYYLYTFITPGKPYVRQMWNFAEAGEGLNTYVNQKIRNNYADRWIPELAEL